MTAMHCSCGAHANDKVCTVLKDAGEASVGEYPYDSGYEMRCGCWSSEHKPQAECPELARLHSIPKSQGGWGPEVPVYMHIDIEGTSRVEAIKTLDFVLRMIKEGENGGENIGGDQPFSFTVNQ